MRKVAALTIIEVLIVTLIVILLAGIVYVVGVPAKEASRRAVCGTQLKNIYSALQLYSIDADASGLYPELHGLSYAWGRDSYMSYLKSPELLICPSTPNQYRRSVTYIVPIFFSPVNSDGTVSASRLDMIKKEAKQGLNLIIAYCTVHDEVFVAPNEPHVDPHLAQRLLIELAVDGRVRQGRFPQFRDFPVTGN